VISWHVFRTEALECHRFAQSDMDMAEDHWDKKCTGRSRSDKGGEDEADNPHCMAFGLDLLGDT
jgi:hypothetical protein